MVEREQVRRVMARWQEVVRVIDPRDVLTAGRTAILLADAAKQEAAVFIGDRDLCGPAPT